MEEKEKKKKKLNSFLIWASLVVLIVFVVITSIVLNFQKQKLDDLNKKNDVVKPQSQQTMFLDLN